MGHGLTVLHVPQDDRLGAMDVLVTRHVFPEAIELLRSHARLDYHNARDGLGAAQLRERVAGKQGLLCQLTDAITAEVIQAADQLRVIANVAVGHDNVDVAAATRRKILVTNTPGVLTESTADLTFALLVAVARRVPEAERYLRDGRWQQWEVDLLCGDDVHGRTLGIVGMGRIGQAVARRAAGFSMEILYHDRTRLARDREQELGATAVSFDELLARSDFVSLHVPASEDTRHMIGAEQLAAMKDSAFLVNTARGPIVDEPALAAALEQHQIAGAGLDVFEAEPEVEPRLLELPNVVLLPHVASASVATRTRMCTMAAENILAVLAKERPPNLVNPEALGNGG